MFLIVALASVVTDPGNDDPRNGSLKGPAKGGIYDNLIADILLKKGIHLNYYKAGESRQEREFPLTENGRIIPLEVKSNNGKTLRWMSSSQSSILRTH